MHMIEPIHGQPPSGYHAPPDPTPYHILRLMTKHRVEPMMACYAPHLAASRDSPPWLAVGAPG